LGTVQSARNAGQKALQVQFMEEENANLRQRVVDLQQTLKINKDIIKTVLEP
jgi:hypothetical protein